MAQLVAAQQGFAVANDVYASRISQDFLAQGSISHKTLYAVILGGVGYIVGTLAFGQGLAGTVKETSRAVTGAILFLGPLLNRASDLVDPQKPKTFLAKCGAAIGGVSGIVIGMVVG